MSEKIKTNSSMKEISLSKVVINIGVGKAGEPLERAKNALTGLTDHKPSVRGAKKRVRDFNIHKGEPIGTMVTLRREDAVDFLRRIMEAKKNSINCRSFDNNGNLSLGIREHIDIPGTKYNPDIGIANIFLKAFGLPALNWLGDTKFAMLSVILVSIWKSVGYFMVLYIAAIMDIPAHYYEAAKVDGANAWQRFWHITLPLLKPATLFVVVLGTIWAFQIFDLVYTLTGGGPGFSTTTLVMHVYNSAFRQFQMGYGTTVAYVLFIIVIIISLIQMKFLKSDEAIY